MSDFADGTNRYADRFMLSRTDRLRLLAHYPQFKLIYCQEYATGWPRAIARCLVPLFGRWRADHNATGPAGTVLVPLRFTRCDVASFMEIFYATCYEIDLDSATTYVDAGANVGLAASYFATQYPIERMLLIEANPDLIETIGETIRGIARPAEIEHAALSDRDGDILFTVGENHRLSGIDYRDGRRVTVPARTLRSMLDLHGFDRVDILKMDIEGAEHEVLAADPEILQRVRCLVGELHCSLERRDVTLALIAGQGFEIKLERSADVDTVVATRR